MSPKYHQKLGCQAKWGGARRARPPLDPPMVMAINILENIFNAYITAES